MTALSPDLACLELTLERRAELEKEILAEAARWALGGRRSTDKLHAATLALYGRPWRWRANETADSADLIEVRPEGERTVCHGRTDDIAALCRRLNAGAEREVAVVP